MSNFVLTHPSFENVKQAVRHIVDKMDEDGFRPNRIVALARGGAILGVCLSHALNVPVTIVAYSSKKGKGDDKNHDNVLPSLDDENLLIVDDLTDSGHSMAEVTEFYTVDKSEEVETPYGPGRRFRNVRTATMYAKEAAAIESDYYWHFLPKNSPFIHFPWETK